jgi:hypothetical protein
VDVSLGNIDPLCLVPHHIWYSVLNVIFIICCRP